MSDKILFETIIGSHVWQMNTLESDLDIFRCYIADTRDILLGKKPKNVFDQKTEGIDLQISEIGNVIEGLIKNNFNYLVAVHSPIVRFDGGILSSLKNLSIRNLSKQAYDSIHGLATQNFKKYVESGVDASTKRCDKIARVLQFGITLLSEGKIEFKPANGNTPETLKKLMDELDMAYKESKLPNKPEHVEELEDFLIKIRIKNIDSFY
mgnify:CR=1 FL=1